MTFSSISNAGRRVRVNTQLSVEEATALQHLFERLTFDDFRDRTANDDEAHALINAAGKLRRVLAAAEELPALPALDD